MYRVIFTLCLVLFAAAMYYSVINNSDRLDRSNIYPTETAAATKAAAFCSYEKNKNKNINIIEEHNIICLHGTIDYNMKTEFTEIKEKHRYFFVLNSFGGDVNSALDIAEQIFENKMDVIVSGVCVSSCANYLFLAGWNKYVLPDSLLGFHGGPAQMSDFLYSGPNQFRKEAFSNYNNMIKGLVIKESKFFAKVDVSNNLIYNTPKNLPKNINILSQFWVYNLMTLNNYGVKNIISYSDPGDRSAIMNAVSFIIGVPCIRINSSVWVCG